MKNKIMSTFFVLSLIVWTVVFPVAAQTRVNNESTADGDYRIVQSIALKKAFEGLDGKIELLKDARVNDGVYFIQNRGLPPELSADDAKTKELFEKIPLRPTLLRTVDGRRKLVDSKPLECLDAEIRVVRLYGALRPSYEITCAYQTVAPYDGYETSFFEVEKGRIRQLEAVDKKTGKTVEMVFVAAQRIGWKYTKTAKGKDILSLEPGWDDAGGTSTVTYRRFHFNGKRWVRYERFSTDNYWDEDMPFPNMSKFPKAL